jgi:hypothetical protein
MNILRSGLRIGIAIAIERHSINVWRQSLFLIAAESSHWLVRGRATGQDRDSGNCSQRTANGPKDIGKAQDISHEGLRLYSQIGDVTVESAHDVVFLIRQLPEERCGVEMVFDASGKP